MVSAVPVELLYHHTDFDKAGFMRLNKLLRLFKLAKMFSVIRLGKAVDNIKTHVERAYGISA